MRFNVLQQGVQEILPDVILYFLLVQKKHLVPSQLLPLENSYYYTMATNTDHHDLPWPTTKSFIDVMLEILTPNDKGITRWTKQSARTEIFEAINNYRKHFLKQHPPPKRISNYSQCKPS